MKQPRDIEKLKIHLESKHHKEAEEYISKGICSFYRIKNTDNILHLLQQIMFIVHNNLSMDLIPKLSFLIFEVSKNSSLYNFGHISNNSCWEFIHCVYSCIMKVLVGGINQSKFYGISLDGSTDISRKEKYSVYIHWIYKSIKLQHFLGLLAVDKTDADSLKGK
jgi:hypothetical protein